jgi:hypothetical protein
MRKMVSEQQARLVPSSEWICLRIAKSSDNDDTANARRKT